MKKKSPLQSLALWFKNRRAKKTTPRPQPRAHKPSVEFLESRIAPATLVSPTVVTFHDADGDTVTVTVSKPIFDAATIDKVFIFDNGSVDGSNVLAQQLQLINFTKLPAAAVAGTDVTITASGGDGLAKIGFIQGGGIDLGAVNVEGDLGRIYAGDKVTSTPGLASLTAHTLGAFGTTTQKAGGSLFSRVNGSLGALNIDLDVTNASIGVGGGANGKIGDVIIGGSLVGGSLDFSGSIRSSGGIGAVHVTGDVTGGAGEQSGLIATAGKITSVNIDGSLLGGDGAFSGAVLSTGDMGPVKIGGDVIGGAGIGSGQIGTAGKLDSVTIGGELLGGSGEKSGSILSIKDMGAIDVTGNVQGVGPFSGQIGTKGNLASVTIGGALIGGASKFSGVVLSAGDMGPVTISGNVQGGQGASSGHIGTFGDLVSVDIGGSLLGGAGSASGFIFSKGAVDEITIDGRMNSATILVGDLGSLTVNGNSGLRGEVLPGLISTLISVSNSTVRATTGSIGSIDISSFYAGVSNSAFDALHDIGSITVQGGMDQALFVAGVNLGDNFASSLANAGAFDNTAAAQFGFGGSGANADKVSAIPASIGTITMRNAEISSPAITNSTFLAGIKGKGADGNFGTLDDATVEDSSIGSVFDAAGIASSTFESGALGASQTFLVPEISKAAAAFNFTFIANPGDLEVSNPIESSTFTATQSTAGGIGSITVAASISDSSHAWAIHNSTFTSAADIGDLSVQLTGTRVEGVENAAISSTDFLAGHAIGSITAFNDATGSAGTAAAISGSHFFAGRTTNGTGGIGSIGAEITDIDVGEEITVDSTVIKNSQFDASAGKGASGDIGDINVLNSYTGTTVGISGSVFRAHGNIGDISSTVSVESSTPSITNSVFSAYGSIGTIDTVGNVMNGARFLAGYDIGNDLTFGNEDTSATSKALQAGQHVGNVHIGGAFIGSDIVASVKPGTAGIFGGDADTNFGTGGSIGTVTIAVVGTNSELVTLGDHSAANAIEASSIGDLNSELSGKQISLNGSHYTIPLVLDNDSSDDITAGDVRVTELPHAG